MTQTAREQINNNLTKLKGYLKSIDQNGKNQALIDLLENTDAIIPSNLGDSVFNQTKEILNIIVPQCRMFEDETPAQQEKLVRKLINNCMTYLLSTSSPTYMTKFDTLIELGMSDLIEQYANNSHIIETSKSTYGFFKRTISIQELLHAVVWSDAEEKLPNKVADILKNDHELLFKKGQITKEGIKTSKNYRFEFMPENSFLKDGVIYICAIDNKISYSLKTPMGIRIENRLTNIDVPTLFTITEKLKKEILNETTKAGYTPTLYEQTYYDVSPFQLILFSGDMYLLERIKPFLTEENRIKARKQCEELQGGGSDLVKLGIIQYGNRIKAMAELSYDELTQFVEKDANGQPRQERVENGLLMDVIYPLQENKDAIVLYNNNYYYVRLNHKTKTVEKIEQIIFITNDEQTKDKFASLFMHMEMNSGRRSNDQEHQLIEGSTTSASNPTGIRLERKGIRYRREDVYYQDCKAESLIFQALRKYNRLCVEAAALHNNPNAVDEARDEARHKCRQTRLDLGKAQAMDTADKLLLYCVKSMSLFSVPDFQVNLGASTKDMKRELMYNTCHSVPSVRDVGIYSENNNSYIGMNFSLETDQIGGACVTRLLSVDGSHRLMAWTTRAQISVEFRCPPELAAFRRYDELSRANVDELTRSLGLTIRNHLTNH